MQSAGCWVLWVGRNGNPLLDGHGIFFWDDENILQLDRDGPLQNFMNALNVTEVYILKWLILCYANFTSI